jgi:MOSC domain-containing protein YiiM
MTELDTVRESPSDEGQLRLIARRPAVDEREVLAEAVIDPEHGLVGDDWSRRPSKATPDGAPHPGKQVTLMNARAAALVAVTEERWALSGDQLYVDLDLSVEHLRPGDHLAIGEVVLEVSPEIHKGCKKFANRFGDDALRFVQSDEGRALRLRGVHTRVVHGGTVRTGDVIHVLAPGASA